MRRRKYKAEPRPGSPTLGLVDLWSRQPIAARAEVVAELRTDAAALHRSAGEVVGLSESTLAQDLGESARARAVVLDIAAELLDACAAGLPLRVADLERLAIIEALRRSKMNTSLAARLLGVGRATLYRRLSLEQDLQRAAVVLEVPALSAELAVQADAQGPAVLVFGHRLGEREAQAVADQIYVALGTLAGREAIGEGQMGVIPPPPPPPPRTREQLAQRGALSLVPSAGDLSIVADAGALSPASDDARARVQRSFDTWPIGGPRLYLLIDETGHEIAVSLQRREPCAPFDLVEVPSGDCRWALTFDGDLTLDGVVRPGARLLTAGEVDTISCERAALQRVEAVVAAHGCDCDDSTCTVPGESCESSGHEPCLAHRVQRAIAGGP